METTLRALAEILLKAVPTLVIVLLLHLYLKRVFFGPLARVLEQRYDATEGARKRADESLQRAAQRAEAYESALQAARSELYREQETYRERRRAEQATVVEDARVRTREGVEESRRQVEHEASQARQDLLADAERLAHEIADRILVKRAA